jgi:alkylated DNA nucleotide flippase Atl1
MPIRIRSEYASAMRRPIDTNTPRARALLDRIRSIPPGRVTTYADLSPEAPRYAGAVLAACHDPEIPWQRVVRADGSLAQGERQRELLEGEGVPFAGERVDMDAVWMPPADRAGGTNGQAVTQ